VISVSLWLNRAVIPFPFTAIVGLERAKRSLIFHAIDPRLGGTLLLGHRGCAKTTLARAFAALLPEGAAFVEVPLGATEDRLLGSVDAQHLLDAGAWRGQRGLIEQAHGGVLYIDEINLLADALADFILDSAATGQYRMERDGLTRHAESRYILIGSMNPDEGELRPQLSDRFAHGVRIADDFSAAERIEIVRRRIAFDDDPQAFAETFADDEKALRSSIHAARERLARVAINDAQRRAIAEKARALQLEGVRAELAVVRTARCAAAFAERDVIHADDIEEAWSLCLGHRDAAQQDAPPPRAREPQVGAPENRGNGSGNVAQQQHQRSANSTAQFPRDAHAEPRRIEPMRPGDPDAHVLEWWTQQRRADEDLNARISDFKSSPHGRHIAWMSSLAAAAARGWKPRNGASENCGSGGWQVRYRNRTRKPHAWLFLDASHSTGAHEFLARARDAAAGLAQRFRAVRWHVLVLHGGRLEWTLRRAPGAHVQRALAGIRAACGKSHLSAALRVLRRAALRGGASPRDRIIFCSDGFVSGAAGEPTRRTVGRFQDALRAITRVKIPLLWLHPAPVRGMSQWLARVCGRLPVTRVRVAD
jgi:Mg-chelatase subunit ChlI